MDVKNADGIPAALGGKVCLISGASRTLGAEIARHMASHGAKVAINYHRSPDAAFALSQEIVANGGIAHAIQADVTVVDDVEALTAETERVLGPVDILVNNVGPYVDTPFLALPVADFDRILSGNVRATFLLSQVVGRAMKARGHGHIVNIAATDYRNRSHSIYGLAKAGVVYLTEALALELAPQVRINALAPDLIADHEDMSDAVVAEAVDGTPLARLVTRAEVAEMACLMCTSAFDMVTGHTVIMDGGRTIPRIALGDAT